MTLLRSSSVEWWKSSKRVRGAGVVWSVRTGETAAAIKSFQIVLVQVVLVVAWENSTRPRAADDSICSFCRDLFFLFSPVAG